VSAESRRPETTATLLHSYGQLEMSFEANEGQVDRSIDFLARGAGYTVQLKSTEAVIALGGRRALHSPTKSAMCVPNPSTARRAPPSCT
jgi:hypothetical protein